MGIVGRGSFPTCHSNLTPPKTHQSPHPTRSLRLCQFKIKTPCHQQFGSLGALSEHFDDAIYWRGVVGGEVTSNDVPLPLTRLQIKANNVRAEIMDGLYYKLQRSLVDHLSSAAVSARRVGKNEDVSVQPTGAKYDRDLGLLKDAHVQVGLRNPPYNQLESAIPDFLYVLRPEPNWCPFLPPCRNIRTPEHPLPTVVFSPPPNVSPAALQSRTA